MRVLFVEDQPETIEPAKESIIGSFDGVYTEECSFADAIDTLRSFRPHLVILDLIGQGSGAEPGVEGLSTYEAIWNTHFCPIVVYSAEKEHFDDTVDPHPLVESEKKGRGSEERVVQAILKLKPYIDALKETEDRVRESLSVAMRDTTLHALATGTSTQNLAEIVTRSGRRRVAAMMDDPIPGESRIASWEMYLYPPVPDQKLLGDILRRVNGDRKDPGSFRIVLTPSCDMVDAGNQRPRVNRVLVAKCCPMSDVIQKMGMQDAAAARLEEELPRRMLNQGYFQDFIPLPPLDGEFPAMAANLKDLDLIPIVYIGSGRKFTRVASVDSPFREQVVWAYLQIAGRPGLPERDTSTWAQDIIKTVGK